MQLEPDNLLTVQFSDIESIRVMVYTYFNPEAKEIGDSVIYLITFFKPETEEISMIHARSLDVVLPRFVETLKNNLRYFNELTPTEYVKLLPLTKAMVSVVLNDSLQAAMYLRAQL